VSTTTPPASTLLLGEELTIQYAAETLASVTAALDAAPSTLSLDLSQVQELDTAGLQVLLWAGREAAGRGIPVDLTVPPAVTEVLDLAGVELSTLATGGVR
jgi:anti-sigma B factor antagonist